MGGLLLSCFLVTLSLSLCSRRHFHYPHVFLLTSLSPCFPPHVRYHHVFLLTFVIPMFSSSLSSSSLCSPRHFHHHHSVLLVISFLSSFSPFDSRLHTTVGLGPHGGCLVGRSEVFLGHHHLVSANTHVSSGGCSIVGLGHPGIVRR